MKYTYKQIVECLPEKKNSNSSWWVKLWVRKVSFFFTYFFINLGFSPNSISVASIFVTLIACSLFMIPNIICVIVATVLINFWLILDCVDGNIARCKKVKTVYGEFVDDIGGYYIVAFIYMAIGVCAYNYGGILIKGNNSIIIILGAISSMCDILARLIHKDYENFSKKVEDNQKERKLESYEVADKHSLDYIRRRIGKELGISGLFMPFAIFCAVVNAYDLMTIFYLLFNGFALVSTTVIYIYKADKYDREHSKNE